MQYLTYEEYTEIGGTLDLTAFMRNINRACSVIDWCTQNRLRAILAPSDAVKACVRDVCELYALNSAGEKQVTSRSQSAGGVSESESYATSTAQEVNEAAVAIIYDYLAAEKDDNGTPLLYRGALR